MIDDVSVLVTVIVKEYAPAAVGVPLKTPADVIVRPVGNVPDVNEYPVLDAFVAARVTENAVPTSPALNVAPVVHVGVVATISEKVWLTNNVDTDVTAFTTNE